MRRIVLAVLVVSVLALSSACFAAGKCDIDVIGINFSKDGNSMRIYCKLINRTGSNIRVNGVTFGKFHFWEDIPDSDRLNAETKLQYDNLGIYIRKNRSVEHTFTLSVTGSGRRYFKTDPKFEYYYKVAYTTM